MNERKLTTIAIIDDHPLFREGLCHLLESRRKFTIVFQADSVFTALEELEKVQPDIMILDMSLKESSGLDLLKDLGVRYNGIPVLVVSMHDEEYYGERALAAGAWGYVMKQEDPGKIIQALEAISQGKKYFSSAVMENHELKDRDARNSPDPIHTLSDREFQIFELIGQGVGLKEIARQLNLGIKTVETHKEHIKSKLGQKTAGNLRQFAVEWRVGH